MGWGTVIGVGLNVAESFLDKKGKQKQEIAARTITDGFARLVPDVPKEVLQDPAIQELLRRQIDASVALRNAVLVKTGKDLFDTHG